MKIGFTRTPSAQKSVGLLTVTERVQTDKNLLAQQTLMANIPHTSQCTLSFARALQDYQQASRQKKDTQ